MGSRKVGHEIKLDKARDGIELLVASVEGRSLRRESGFIGLSVWLRDTRNGLKNLVWCFGAKVLVPNIDGKVKIEELLVAFKRIARCAGEGAMRAGARCRACCRGPPREDAEHCRRAVSLEGGTCRDQGAGASPMRQQTKTGQVLGTAHVAPTHPAHPLLPHGMEQQCCMME